jgi:cytochrome c oxidase assembly factor CtaG/polyferredoxin
MNPTLDAFLRSWPFAPWLAVNLLILGVIYLRGWRLLHRRDPERWHVGRPAAFLVGLATIYLAVASPIETFASLLLQVHMAQHMLLMMIAPPLIWLGWPLFPVLLGLPLPIRTYWVVPLLQWRPLRDAFAFLTQPFVAWPIYVGTTWLWHTPRGYELGLSQDNWHVIQHTCFLASALLFWYPVVRPYPSRPRWSRWLLFPYLLLADLQNTLLAAWLCFSPVVLYPYYLRVPRLAGISTLDDQATAGVLMWVPGSIALLLPLFWIGVSYLLNSPREADSRKTVRRPRQRVTPSPLLPILDSRLPSVSAPAFDLMRVPLLGQFLRWRLARPAMQLLMMMLAAVVIFDGLNGPQVSPMNLAGTLPWIHWRGLLILSLLVAGNAFCMACPFTLPRRLARRWFSKGRPWPRGLRSKWLATGLVATFLWSYEAFALWDSPWVTAWIAIGYFVAAFVVDTCFSGAAFCKYICPIGQFNFVQALVSPLEVSIRQPAVCTSCTSKECIRGNSTIPGCETHLFQASKHGNLDCTFCLDCVHVCPHKNVGILAVVPGQTLWSDSFRSGIGRFSTRADLAALALVLVFGAFANAAGMILPVVEWQNQFAQLFGNLPSRAITSATYLIALVILPLILVAIVSVTSRRWAKLEESTLRTATRFAYALVPLGFAMWLAHYSFHFFTSWQSLWPVTQRFAQDHGWAVLGTPEWACACCASAATWIPRAELLFLDLGLLGSLYAAYRIAELNARSAAQVVKSFMPWATLVVLLFIVAVWIIYQPMQMRGTMSPAG